MKELYPGDQGIWVQYLQLALQRAGQQVMLDGIFGPKTCAAVEKVMGSSGKCAVKEAQWNRLLPFLRGYITHEVKAGDTFFSIAKMYDTTMERVMHANPGTDAGALQIGSTVVVPLNFPLVSGEVPYTSLLTGWIIEGLQARYPYLQVGTIGRSVMGTPLWFRYSEYLDTIAKLSPQKEKSEFYYYLFSESGFDDKILEEATNADNITLCNLSDIVEKRKSEI